MLQTTVRRAYTTAFAGQLTEDGPRRARPARIVGADPLNPNRMSRAFTYVGQIPDPASVEVGTGYVSEVQLGGTAAQFFGILGNPQAQALYGIAGDTLAASMDLPYGALGEFFDMATGICVELFNETAAAITNHFGDQIAFATAKQATTGVPNGGLVALPPGAAAPAGYVIIPNARLVRTLTLPAVVGGVPVSALSIIQLTQ